VLQRLVRLHLEDGKVELRVLAEDLGLEAGAVGEDHADVVRVADHVVVGDDDSGGVDDEAGAGGVRAALLLTGRVVALAAFALAAPVEELLEQILERRAGRELRHRPAAGLDRRRGRDVDYRVGHPLDEIGEGFGGRARIGGQRHGEGDERESRDERSEKAPGGERHGPDEDVHLIHWNPRF
jgi:hypothetical protein